MWFQCISDIFLMSGMGRGGMLEVVFDSGVVGVLETSEHGGDGQWSPARKE